MSGIANVFSWVTDWWNGNNKVQCVECGQYYSQRIEVEDQKGNNKEIINICGEACFSTYIMRKDGQLKYNTSGVNFRGGS